MSVLTDRSSRLALPDTGWLGVQTPRFWTAPGRHRDKTEGCPACANRDYAAGCGNYQAADMLGWARGFGYDLDPWQEWWLTELCGTRPDGRWASFENYLVVSRQNGKNPVQCSMDILTTNGWTTIGEIQPGQHVYGSGGQPIRVVACSPVYPDEDCYEVSFTDGSSYVVSADHLWWVHHKHATDRRGWHARRTADLMQSVGGRRADNGRMEYNWRVRCDAVPQTPHASLPIDPYLLGYWLGDGASNDPRLFTAKRDQEWAEAAIRAAGADVRGVRTHPVTGVQEISFGYGTPRKQIGGFWHRARSVGLYRGVKRIPDIYLTAAPEQRLALLRGLMDTDGSIAITNKSPQVEYATSSPGLAEDFLRLARSLGIRVTAKEGKTSYQDKNGERVWCKDRARFLWTPAFNPFAMPRKAEQWRPPMSRRHELMSITSVRPVPSRPTRCIEVDSSDHVYLLGRNFTPTHNCALEVRELAGMFLFGESMIIHTAHEFKAAAEHFRRVRDVVTGYDELRRRVKSVTTSHGDEAIELRPASTLIFGSGGRRIRRNVSARLRFLARSRGSGRAFTADCVVYDESMILSDEVVGASLPTLSAVPNPQVIYTASAGYRDSVQLSAVRRRVLARDPRIMGAEWSINPHLDTCPRDEVRGRRSNRYVVCGLHDDRDDPRSWGKANPALGVRISSGHVRDEMGAMTMATFDRERLGVGDWPGGEEAWAVISEEAWTACAMPAPGGAARPVAFAVDVDPDMISAAIASAWIRPAQAGSPVPRPVIEIPRGCHREGVNWVIPQLLALRRTWRPLAVAIPRNGPAAGLIDDAENAGIEVLKMSSADEAAAFAFLVTTVRKPPEEGRLIHLGRDLAPGLWSSVASAETRDVGDGGRAWSRRDSASDITPVSAGTDALWALNHKRRNYDPLASVR